MQLPKRVRATSLVWISTFLWLQPLLAQQLPFWRAESPEGKELWLLGSIHAGDENMFPLDPLIEQAFDASDVLAVELEIDKVDTEALTADLVERAQLPEGQTLFDLLPSDTYFGLDAALNKYRLQLIDLNSYKPWYPLWLLTSLPATGPGGLDPDQGVDLHYLRAARDSAKDVVALETIDEQLSIFTGIPIEEQVNLLSATLRELDKAKPDDPRRMLEAWRSGDTDELASFMKTDAGEDPALLAFQERLLDRRNALMAQRIDKLVDETAGEVFVVVGTLHLVGEGSVVELLEQQGYSITQQAASEAPAE